MRTWPMICITAALVASGGAAQSQAVSSEDCTLRATHEEQIACLQEVVTALRQEMQVLLLMRQVDLASLDRILAHRSLEAMIDRKIREAMEPRLRLLQRP